MWKKRLNSFQFAFAGLRVFFSTQWNARFEAVAAVGAIALGFFLKISTVEWLAVVLAIALVLALEAMNTALEFLTDLVSPQKNPLAGRAKDVAAAAVLLASMGAAAVGAIIFLPKIGRLFF